MSLRERVHSEFVQLFAVGSKKTEQKKDNKFRIVCSFLTSIVNKEIRTLATGLSSFLLELEVFILRTAFGWTAFCCDSFLLSTAF